MIEAGLWESKEDRSIHLLKSLSPKPDLLSHITSFGITISNKTQNMGKYGSKPLIAVLIFSA